MKEGERTCECLSVMASLEDRGYMKWERKFLHLLYSITLLFDLAIISL